MLPLEILDLILFFLSKEDWCRLALQGHPFDVLYSGKHRKRRRIECILDRKEILNGTSPFLLFPEVRSVLNMNKKAVANFVKRFGVAGSFGNREIVLISLIKGGWINTFCKEVLSYELEVINQACKSVRVRILSKLIKKREADFFTREFLVSLTKRGFTTELKMIVERYNLEKREMSFCFRKVKHDSLFLYLDSRYDIDTIFQGRSFPKYLSNKSVNILYERGIFPKEPRSNNFQGTLYRTEVINKPSLFCSLYGSSKAVSAYLSYCKGSPKKYVEAASKLFTKLLEEEKVLFRGYCVRNTRLLLKACKSLTTKETRAVIHFLLPDAVLLFLNQPNVLLLAVKSLSFSFFSRVIESKTFLTSDSPISLWTLYTFIDVITKELFMHLVTKRRIVECRHSSVIKELIRRYGMNLSLYVIVKYINTTGDYGFLLDYVRSSNTEEQWRSKNAVNDDLSIFPLHVLYGVIECALRKLKEKTDHELAKKILPLIERTKVKLNPYDVIYPSFYLIIRQLCSEEIVSTPEMIRFCKKSSGIKASSVLLILSSMANIKTGKCNFLNAKGTNCKNTPKKGSCCCGVHHNKSIAHMREHGVILSDIGPIVC